MKEVEDMFFKLAFAGPPGVAYPQLRPEIDSFDDRLRKLGGPEEQPLDDALIVKKPISTIPDDKSQAQSSSGEH